MKHLEHLSKDMRLAKIIATIDISSITRKKNIYLYLCASIMSQQLSTKVAAIINQRFLDLFGKKNPTPQDVLDLPFDTLRSIGLSNSKTHYVRNVSAFFLQEKLTDKKLYNMNDEEIMAKLIQIKGVGKWTVEMLMMFGLGHEDVFSPDDFGIRQSMIRLYKLDDTSPKDLRLQMHKISEKWRPYRTYACLYLWAWKDKK